MCGLGHFMSRLARERGVDGSIQIFFFLGIDCRTIEVFVFAVPLQEYAMTWCT